MSLESLPIILVTSVMALLHGVFVVVGLMLVKGAKGWGSVFAVVAGVSLASILLSMAGFLLQGGERARDILLPGGQLFSFVFLPAILNAVISSVIIMSAAYVLFVEPGNEKNV